jgi:DNA polymerase-3 subunit gamma/tau
MLIAKTSPSSKEMVMLTEDTWQQLCQIAKSWETTTILAGQQHLRQCEVQIKLSNQPQLWLEVGILGLLPAANSINSSNSNQFVSISENPPWTNWKTPTDAIVWAQHKLPNMSVESLQEYWNSLIPVNGKKAPVWVETVQQLASSR